MIKIIKGIIKYSYYKLLIKIDHKEKDKLGSFLISGKMSQDSILPRLDM